jgi:hypothetical protein
MVLGRVRGSTAEEYAELRVSAAPAAKVRRRDEDAGDRGNDRADPPPLVAAVAEENGDRPRERRDRCQHDEDGSRRLLDCLAEQLPRARDERRHAEEAETYVAEDGHERGPDDPPRRLDRARSEDDVALAERAEPTMSTHGTASVSERIAVTQPSCSSRLRQATRELGSGIGGAVGGVGSISARHARTAGTATTARMAASAKICRSVSSESASLGRPASSRRSRTGQ